MIVKQIDTFLSLVELFAHERQPMTLTRIADELGQPKSSTHNMIETLVERGYLYEVRQRGGFYPSSRLLRMAQAIAEGDPVVGLIGPHLSALSRETGETALLAIRDRQQAVYLGVAEPQQPIIYNAAVGDRRPIYATSGGKAILASYPEDERARELARLTFSEVRKDTIRDAVTLEANLREGLMRGYFTNVSEYTPEVTGVGIPIAVDGRRMALSVAGPNYRVSGQEAALAAVLCRYADEIYHTLTAAGVSCGGEEPDSAGTGAGGRAVSKRKEDETT